MQKESLLPDTDENQSKLFYSIYFFSKAYFFYFKGKVNRLKQFLMIPRQVRKFLYSTT